MHRFAPSRIPGWIALLAVFLLAALPGAAWAQATGVLEVRANVDGALVLIDGEPLGETPLIEVIEAGRHSIVVTRDGFADFESTFTLRPDATVEVVAEMQRIAPGLQVDVDVPDAVVFLDGKQVGSGSKVVVDPAPAGRHRLLVRSKEFGDWEKDVELKSGKLVPVKVSLRGSLGSIVVKSDPAGAVILRL